MSDQPEEFYVGYMKKAPQGMARFLKWQILALLLIGFGVAAGIAFTQKNVLPVTFEFGVFRNLEGIVYETPYPHLLVDRPQADGEASAFSRYLLVAPGKFGANKLVEGLHGQQVALKGSLIYKDNKVMIEVQPDSIISRGDSERTSKVEALGEHTFIGEIVDSKCYLGVMNPGNTKVHKACAIRCISGGIPPVFLVRNAEGEARYFMLVNENREAVNQQVLTMIAEPLEITGDVEKLDNLLILKANPETYTRL